MSDPQPQPETAAEARLTFAVVLLSSFLTPFMGSALNVALPAIGREFGLHAVGLGWVATAYILAAATLLVPCGRLGDLLGRRRLFLRGMLLYALGALLSAAAPNGGVLIAARFLNGAGAAMGFATGMAMLTTAAAPAQRGRVLGWNIAAVYLGLSLGPVIGGFFTQHLGWRWIFLATALAATPPVWLARGWLCEPPPPRTPGDRFDWRGTLIYAGALSALIVGFARLPHLLGLVLTPLGLVGLWLFVRWERRCPQPVFDLTLFLENRVFALANLAALINYSATAATAFLLSLYLQHLQGLSPQQAGLVLILQPLVMTLLSPVAGLLSDRVPPSYLASAGMALTAVGLALFAWIGPASHLGLIRAGLAALGVGFALFSAPNTVAVMNAVAPHQYGLASGTLGTMRLTGQMLSMGLVLLMLALFLHDRPIAPATHLAFLQGLRVAFLGFTGLCILGVWASLARHTARAPRPIQG